MPKTLLLEIGSDEIPARYLPLAFDQLRIRSEGAFRESRLGFDRICVFGTPRRLCLYVQGVADAGDDTSQEVRGPSKKVAYDGEDNPTKALLGFARSIGVEPSDLTERTERGGEYLYGTKFEKGLPAASILEKILPGVVMGMECPHPLRWGDQDWRWYRAIRWVVCLLGSEVVPVEIAGKVGGRSTYGHRTLHPGQAEIPDADSYFRVMENCSVVVDQDLRRKQIVMGAQWWAKDISGVPLIDEDLLSEVVSISEHPSAFLGRFDDQYLSLPRDVLFTAMRHHQRYFPTVDGDGGVLPGFIGVRDGDPEEGIDIVRRGNEWVLRARLADAEFFYEQDLKISLEDRLDDLKGVRFLRNAGTMYEKTLRLKQLTGDFASKLGLSADDAERARQAANLSKCDLTTALVREFPELEGIMGGLYAANEGFHADVAKALAQQYLPRGSKDPIPDGQVGSVLALSDKMDTLAVAFSLGVEVSGSQDPMGLRRAALGVVGILSGRGYDVDLDSLLEMPLELASKAVLEPAENAREKLSAFLVSRIETGLLEKGYSPGIVRAVLGGKERRVPRIPFMAEALHSVSRTSELEDVVIGWRRTSVLGKASSSRQVSPELLQEEAEEDLYLIVTQQRERADELFQGQQYKDYLLLLASLRRPIDECLDQVLIMAEDPSVKANRLALLGTVSDLFTGFADFSHVLSLV